MPQQRCSLFLFHSLSVCVFQFFRFIFHYQREFSPTALMFVIRFSFSGRCHSIFNNCCKLFCTFIFRVSNKSIVIQLLRCIHEQVPYTIWFVSVRVHFMTRVGRSVGWYNSKGISKYYEQLTNDSMFLSIYLSSQQVKWIMHFPFVCQIALCSF